MLEWPRTGGAGGLEHGLLEGHGGEEGACYQTGGQADGPGDEGRLCSY